MRIAPLAAAVLVSVALAHAVPADERGAAVAREVTAATPRLVALYRELHSSPELSFQESATAARLAARMRALGFEVTEGVGRTGIVAVLRNGEGPTVLLRTDLDALPVEEKTGLPYASHATGRGPGGEPVPVMHACGHDIHMTSWLGAATVLADLKDDWRGTVVMIGQPAEELGAGSAAMLADGLYTRFPRPDFAVALHDMPDLPAGVVAISPGPVAASADSVDVTFFGRGGHGAQPQATVDPIVMASRFVLAVQTLVSRENDPFDPAVVTVGAFHAGSKHNIIPDLAHLEMTVRAYREEVRQRLLGGIRRIARAEAEAAGAPKPPEVTVSEGTPSTTNDAALAVRLAGAFRRSLGDERVVAQRPIMAAEDFSNYGRAGVPAVLMWLGATAPDRLEHAHRAGVPLPGLHSPEFYPDAEPTIAGGATVLSLAALELLASR
ncbi:MAG: amidohydrolase [Acidobacteriota bacterium]